MKNFKDNLITILVVIAIIFVPTVCTYCDYKAYKQRFPEVAPWTYLFKR